MIVFVQGSIHVVERGRMRKFLLGSLGLEFRKLYLATAFSNLADGMSLAAFPLLVARFSTSPVDIGYVVAARTLPWLLLSLPAGAFIDWIGCKIIMGWVNIGRMIVAALLVGLILTEHINLVSLISVAGLLGCLEVFFDNAAQSILPRIVPKASLTAALGQQQSAELIINKFIGIPIGAFLMGLQTYWAFTGIGLAYVLAALFIHFVHSPPQEKENAQQRSSLWSELFAGVQYVLKHPVLSVLALNTGFANFTIQAVEVVFVLFVTQAIQLPEWAFGLLMSMEALGGILGSFLVVPLKNRFGEGFILRGVILTLPFVVLLTPLFLNVWIVAMARFLLGTSDALWNAIAVSFRQAILPSRLMGRANAFYRLLAWGSVPLGSLAGGWSAGTFGYVGNYLVVGVVLALSWAIVPRLNQKRLQAARKEADEKEAAPVAAVATP